MIKVKLAMPVGGAERLIKRWREEPEVRAKLAALGVTEIMLEGMLGETPPLPEHRPPERIDG